ncbi:MAG: hypothetical protein ACO3BJ_02820 [Burkholderiaceae bacterium]
MRLYGYAAEILGLSPYWRRRPRLQKLMVFYEASASQGQSASSQAKLSGAWLAIQTYFSQYLQSRGQRNNTLESAHFVMNICAASDSRISQARLQEALADPNLVALVLVHSPEGTLGQMEHASEPANPSLLVHRMACVDSANPTSAKTRRQIYSILLASLSAGPGHRQPSPSGSPPGSSPLLGSCA